MLRYPSLRAPIDILFLVCCIVLTADVLGPEILGHGKTKDYPLWFWAGQQVLHGGNLYPSDPRSYFEFIYPPLPAVLLAIPAYFGKLFLYTCLALLNAVAWWMTAQLSSAMTGSGRTPGPWLYALPGFATVTFVFDMFDLGQPNLVLLAMMLYGFWLLQHERPWLGGSMFALATAIKVFPVAVFPYLVWRRQWAAAASMVVFTAIFLFVVPAPVRGFQHNVSELKTWFQGMVGTSSEQGFGQRGEQNWSWVNQSIIAVTHRLTRPVNFNQDDPAKPPAYMNVADVSFETANWIVLAVSLADRARLHRGDAAAQAGDAAFQCRRTRHPVLPDDGGFAAGPAVLFPVAVLSDHGPDAPGGLRSPRGRAGRHLGRPRGRGTADVPVVAAVPEGSAGVREQSRRHRRDCRGTGLAYPASAAG